MVSTLEFESSDPSSISVEPHVFFCDRCGDFSISHIFPGHKKEKAGPAVRALVEHWWSNGRILACHAGGPGSIPGQCRIAWSSPKTSTKCSHEGDTRWKKNPKHRGLVEKLSLTSCVEKKRDKVLILPPCSQESETLRFRLTNLLTVQVPWCNGQHSGL